MTEKLQNKKQKNAISAEVYGQYNQPENFVPKIIEKTELQKTQISKILEKSFMFKNLSPKDFQTIIDAMEIKNFEQNDRVITQGDDGFELYIVSEGKLKCTKTFPNTQEEIFLKFYNIGEVFGELALFYNTPRAANIYAETKSTLFCLDRLTFNFTIKKTAFEKREKFEKIIEKIEIFNSMDSYEKSKISDVLTEEIFLKN